jgi:hypothetical protein
MRESVDVGLRSSQLAQNSTIHWFAVMGLASPLRQQSWVAMLIEPFERGLAPTYSISWHILQHTQLI